MALVNKDAALMVKDQDAVEKLTDCVNALIENRGQIASYERNILSLAKTDAARVIAQECIRLGNKNR